MTGQRQTEPVCYGCGKPGHIQANCPDKKAKLHTAAACVQKEDMGTTDNVTPTDNLQGVEHPPEDKDIERDYLPLDEEEHSDETARDDEYPLSQYKWDNEDNDTGSSFRVNALSTPDMGYCVRKSHMVTHDKQVITITCGPDHNSSNVIHLQAVSCIITASILHFKVHTTYCIRLSTATGA